jgi:poly[ADP-ribose] polymerase 16
MTTAPTQTTPGLNVEERRAMLQQKLDDIFLSKDKSGILALDLEMNLLICSAQSYKHESVLKPFPSTFLSDSNNDKNFAQLLTALMSLPPVLDWRSKLKSFDDQQLAVLHWLFTHKNYQLELATSIDQVLNQT